jgi:hypothetical protein
MSPRTLDIIELSESEEDNKCGTSSATKLRARCCEPEHCGVIDLTLSQSDSDREGTSQLQSADRRAQFNPNKHPRLGAKPSKKGHAALESEKGTRETRKLTDIQSIRRKQHIPFGNSANSANKFY